MLDALRPHDGTRFHPGETNLAMADVVVVNKIDAATPVDAIVADLRQVNPDAVVILGRSRR